MKKLALTAVALASILWPASSFAQTRKLDSAATIRTLNGAPTFLGVIVATTTKNNSNTAATFTIPLGQFLLVQCDAAGFLYPGSTTAITATTANGVKVIADEKYYLMLKSDQAYLAAVAVTGTANCRVWRVD